MIELTAGHYDSLCRADPVRTEIGAAETKRRDALRQFWTRLAIGTVVAVGAGYLVGLEYGWIAGMVLLIIAVIVAWLPLNRAKEDLKHPVLETIAGQCGLHYMPEGFDPPVMPEAVGPLFGSFSSSRFTDLFWGEDEEGRRFAVYEAKLERRSGKNTHTVFQGQVFAFQRRRAGRGTTVIRPDWGIFNFFKPKGGMQRVEIKTDNAFEKKFAAYGTDALETQQLLFDGGLRRTLLELRQSGRVWAYVAGEDALVAVWGKDRFEPGSMFRKRSGEERVRSMFEDVRGSLATLRELRASLG